MVYDRLLNYKERSYMKRAQWITAKVTTAAVVAIDSLFCATDGELEATQEELEGVAKDIANHASENQLENAYYVISLASKERCKRT